MKPLHKKLYEYLDIVNEYANKYDIKLLAAYGTLLGATRDKGIIEWDDDIDLKIFEEDESKLLLMIKQIEKELGWVGYFHASINAYKFKTKEGKMIPVDIFVFRKAVEKISFCKKIKSNLILVKLFKWKDIKVIRNKMYRISTYVIKPIAHLLILNKVTHQNVIDTLKDKNSLIYADISGPTLWSKSKTPLITDYKTVKFGPTKINVQNNAEERLKQEYGDWETPKIWEDHGNE